MHSKISDLVRQQSALVVALLLCGLVDLARAQTTAFTYQGKLTDNGNPANGNYDMQFKLFDTATVGTGTQQGATITNPTVPVAAGSFTVQLDFGASVFNGTARYLEIGVRPAGNPNPYTVLEPRAQITSSPYAIQTINAQQLGGLSASRYVATDVNGNAAIGAGTPAHRLAVLGGPCWTGDCWGGALELENSAAIAWRQNTSGVKFGIGRTENGLFFFRTNSPLGTTTNGPIYDFKMDNSGNVGIGNLGISTDLSGARLSLFNAGAGYGLKHTDGIVKLGTYIGVTAPDNIRGGWLGTESNHRLHLFVNNGNPSLTVDTTGNIGIGTVIPTARLQVDAGNSVGVLANSQGNAIIGYSSTSGFAAVYGENTSGASGYGVYGKGTTGYALYADGNAGQSLNKGGIIKAMIFVLADGTIARCYNGMTGASTGNCGFTVSTVSGSAGFYTVNFGFSVADRFFSVIPNGTDTSDTAAKILGINPNGTLSLRTFDTNNTAIGENVVSDFYLIVF